MSSITIAPLFGCAEQHPLKKKVGSNKSEVAFRKPVIRYITVAFVREYARGVTRTMDDLTAQCPFSTNSTVEDHHLKEKAALASMCQENPPTGIRMSSSREGRPFCSFLGYQDMASASDREARGATLSLDVSHIPNPSSCMEVVSAFSCLFASVLLWELLCF